jgi:hypothetical protein
MDWGVLTVRTWVDGKIWIGLGTLALARPGARIGPGLRLLLDRASIIPSNIEYNYIINLKKGKILLNLPIYNLSYYKLKIL